MAAVIAMIWSFLGPYLVSMALSSGLPALVAYLQKQKWPQWIIDGLVAFVNAAVGQAKQMHEVVMTAHSDVKAIKGDPSLSKAEKKSRIKTVKNLAHREAQKVCQGVGCSSEPI